ncbi:MAG: lipopolysaccharide biosynthesis protein [Pseudomonadota bacterium]
MSDTPVQAPTKDLKGRAVRGSTIILGAQAFQMVLQVASVMILARLLAPADFGIVAMVAPVQALAVLIKTIGLGDAVIQRQDLKTSQLNALFWIQLAVCAGLSLTMALLAPAVAWFYDREVLVAITIAYSSVILLGGLGSMHENLLTRRMAFKKVAFVQLTAAVLGFATGIVAAMILQNYWALVLMVIARAAIETVLFWALARWLPGRPRSAEKIGELLRFGGSVAGAKMAHYVANNSTTILLGKVLGEVSLGLYDRANRLLVYPTAQLHKPLQNVGIPLLSRLQDDDQRYRKAFVTILQGLAVIAAPGLVSFVVFSDEVVLLAFGEGWSAVAPIFALLAPVTLSQLINHPLAWLFFTQGRPGEMVAWAWTRSLLLLAAVIAGLPYGLIGVVAAYAGTQLLIVTPAIWIWSTRIGPVRLKDALRAILPYLAGIPPTLLVLEIMHRRLDLGAAAELALAILAAYAIMGLISLAFPQGRSGLKDLIALRHQLAKKRGGRRVEATPAEEPSSAAVVAKGA